MDSNVRNRRTVFWKTADEAQLSATLCVRQSPRPRRRVKEGGPRRRHAHTALKPLVAAMLADRPEQHRPQTDLACSDLIFLCCCSGCRCLYRFA